MRAKAGVDRAELLGLGIIDRDLAGVLEEPLVGHVEGIKLSRAERRAFLAIVRNVLRRPVLRRPIDATVLVHHRGVRVDLAIPSLLQAPISRGDNYLVG